MFDLKTLPLLENARTIVVEEGIDANYSSALIAGWLQMWREQDPDRTIKVLSFSNPKLWYVNASEAYTSKNVDVLDYYTLNTDRIEEDEAFHSLEKIVENVRDSTVIIDCLSSLTLYVGLARALWFVETVGKRAAQYVCIFKRDFVVGKVPCIETLGTTYVKLERHSNTHTNNDLSYIARYTHKKSGRSVLRESLLVNQNITSYEITSTKLKVQNVARIDTTSLKSNGKVTSSFRLDTNEREKEQKESTPLPYVLSTNTNSSKILYVPDDVDDLDEEDPDDDLCF